jgi:hypothetical protein
MEPCPFFKPAVQGSSNVRGDGAVRMLHFVCEWQSCHLYCEYGIDKAVEHWRVKLLVSRLSRALASSVQTGSLLCMSTKLSSIVRVARQPGFCCLLVNSALNACCAVTWRLKEKLGCVKGCAASKTSSWQGRSHSISGSHILQGMPLKNKKAQSVNNI